MIHSASQLLVLLLISSSYVGAQQVSRRFAQATVVAGNWLYLDGGEVSYEVGHPMPETTTYGIDLSKRWTNASLEFVSTPRPPASLAMNYQRLWWSAARNAVFCFGGEVAVTNGSIDLSVVPPESIWQFVPHGNGTGTWAEAVGPTGLVPYPSTLLRAANGASTSSGDHGYYVGGYIGELTTKSITEFEFYRQAGGLQTFDFRSLALTNTSDGGYFAAQYLDLSAYYDPGNMLYVPSFGVDGVLILLGGGGQSGPFVHQLLPGQGTFDNITIYDIHTQSWHFQSATGAVPDSRAKFCAVGAQSSNNATFEIFIFGGILNNLLGPANAGADQVYVLSLPSFQWFQAPYPSQYPRAQHSCVVAGGNQMISIGGLDPSEVTAASSGLWNAFSGTSDPWAQTIGVFDMTALKWKDSYEPGPSPYVSPDVVTQYLDTRNGSMYPPSWSSSAVQALFESSPSNATSRPPPTTQTSSRLSTPTIVGIAIGSVLIIIILAAGLWYLRTKGKYTPNNLMRRRRTQIHPTASKANFSKDKIGYVHVHELSEMQPQPAELRDSRVCSELAVSEPPTELAADRYRARRQYS